MPYWFETKNLRVGKERDKRRKLSDGDRERIKELYYKNNYPIRKIARMFKDKCSRRNIQFILFPERLERQYFHRRKRNWDYDREKRKKYMKNHRKHLVEIYGLQRKKR